jgi:hypothetical protein
MNASKIYKNETVCLHTEQNDISWLFLLFDIHIFFKGPFETDITTYDGNISMYEFLD